MQSRGRRDVELDQSAGYEEQLDESRRKEKGGDSMTVFGVRGRGEMARSTDLYCPLNPFLVNTLPALTMLLHVLSGHQLYSDVSTGVSEFIGGSGGVHQFP